MSRLIDVGGVSALRAEASLTERVTELLLSGITGGQYALGDVLPPEQSIAEQIGVSRTVLREAVARLKAEGYVTSKQGRGLIVTANRRSAVLKMHAAEVGDVDEVLAIVELRQGLEVAAAALAAQRRTEDDLVTMKAAVDRMGAAIKSGNVAAGVQADLDFHRAIAVATRNDHYVRLFGFIAELYKKNLSMSREESKRAGRAAYAQAEHERLYAAIEQGDVEQARECAATHVANTAKRLRQRGREASVAAKSSKGNRP
ncbi:MAG: FadR/GntR family transcriptional regulator [Burkholderiaceae bacterium]